MKSDSDVRVQYCVIDLLEPEQRYCNYVIPRVGGVQRPVMLLRSMTGPSYDDDYLF